MDRWMDYETAGPLHSYIKGPPPASYSPVHSYRLVCFQDFYDNRYLFLCRLREMKKKKKTKSKCRLCPQTGPVNLFLILLRLHRDVEFSEFISSLPNHHGS